ncbi:MAG TPA: hypothetical protein PKJ98_16835 [Verrucomicrobiota bacterium]|nr:hypothetical protein [Verrucomicrobiota bacterium]
MKPTIRTSSLVLVLAAQSTALAALPDLRRAEAQAGIWALVMLACLIASVVFLVFRLRARKEPERREKAKRSLIGLAVSVVTLLLCAIPFAAARTEAQTQACLINLTMITKAKDQWALDKKKTPEAVPTFGELSEYLRVLPCPAGGSYTIGRVGDLPRCSVHGDGGSSVVRQTR